MGVVALGTVGGLFAVFASLAVWMTDGAASGGATVNILAFFAALAGLSGTWIAGMSPAKGGWLMALSAISLFVVMGVGVLGLIAGVPMLVGGLAGVAQGLRHHPH